MASLLDKIRGGGKRKPAARHTTRKPAARKPAGHHSARKPTGAKRRVTHTTKPKSSASRMRRRAYMTQYMREYRANLKQRGYTLDKHGRKHKMTAAQRERWNKRKGHHAKNWNHKQSSSKINAEKRGERKSKLVRAKKSRHGRKLSTGQSARVKVSEKGKVRGFTSKRKRR